MENFRNEYMAVINIRSDEKSRKKKRFFPGVIIIEFRKVLQISYFMKLQGVLQIISFEI